MGVLGNRAGQTGDNKIEIYKTPMSATLLPGVFGAERAQCSHEHAETASNIKNDVFARLPSAAARTMQQCRSEFINVNCCPVLQGLKSCSEAAGLTLKRKSKPAHIGRHIPRT